MSRRRAILAAAALGWVLGVRYHPFGYFAAQLFELMAAHPGLIQRPIVVKGARAVVARPVEAVETLLK